VYTIVCFGDSNTWGYDPATCTRYPPDCRWPRVLSSTLEAIRPGEFEVVAEGQNGRTTVWDDPVEGERNGSRYLIPCLESNKPLDLLVILLGTNDLKHRFGLSAFDIAKGALRLALMARASATGPGDSAPAVLLIAPPPLAPMTGFAKNFEGGREISGKLGLEFAELAAANGIPCLDAGTVVRSSEVDGIHLDPEEQVKLGKAVAARVLDMFGN
jgi:lysophospholipase L1-like esterase